MIIDILLIIVSLFVLAALIICLAELHYRRLALIRDKRLLTDSATLLYNQAVHNVKNWHDIRDARWKVHDDGAWLIYLQHSPEMSVLRHNYEELITEIEEL
jgi:hypothetical protein